MSNENEQIISTKSFRISLFTDLMGEQSIVICKSTENETASAWFTLADFMKRVFSIHSG